MVTFCRWLRKERCTLPVLGHGCSRSPEAGLLRALRGLLFSIRRSFAHLKLSQKFDLLDQVDRFSSLLYGIKVEKEKATSESLRDSKSSAWKAAGNLLFFLKDAETAKLLKDGLGSCRIRELESPKQENVLRLSLCFLL